MSVYDPGFIEKVLREYEDECAPKLLGWRRTVCFALLGALFMVPVALVAVAVVGMGR